MRPQIHKKLVEEIQALNRVKFQLGQKVQFLDSSEEYTDPVLARGRKPFYKLTR